MKKHLWLIKKISVTVTAILLGFLITATTIAVENKSAVSSFFGSKTFETIETGEVTDAAAKEYFKSDFKTLKEVNDAAQAVGEEIEAEGAVLIKNDKNTLPLAKGSKISMFGIATADPAYGGRGSAQSGNPGKMVTLQEGLTAAGMTVNEKLLDFYTKDIALGKQSKYKHAQRGGALNDAPWNDIVTTDGVAASFGNFGDVAIFMYSRASGEGADTSWKGTKGATDGDYLKLCINEDQVLRKLKEEKDKGTFKKIVVLMNTSLQLECSYLSDPAYGVDAALWIGNVGQNGFSAVGKILAGDLTPSGRLNDMFWNSHADNPVMTNFGTYKYTNLSEFDIPEKKGYDGKLAPDTQFTSYVVYQEGIYLGYRYAETRYEDIVLKTDKAGTFDYNKVVTTPFGGGLSYTNFSYSNFAVKKDGNKYKVSLTVKNDGATYSGKEVVQIYLQKPYTQYDKDNGVEQAAVELVGFAKTGKLAPGASEQVSVTVDEKYFSSYDANKAKTYIIEDGTYYLAAGKDAHNALNNILAAKGKTKADGMDADGNKDLVKSFKKNFDAKKYAVTEKGKKITNLFDQADINKYSGKGDNSVKYMTRSDWAGTVKLNRDDSIKLKMTKQILADMLAQIDITSIKTDDIALPTYGAKNGLLLMNLKTDSEGNKIAYDDPAWNKILDQLTWEETVLLCSTGFRKTAGIASIAKPETKDHNGPNGLTQPYAENPFGLAARSGIDIKDKTRPVSYPCSGIVASMFNPEMALKFGDSIGEEAIWAGYAGFYGVAVNTHRTPYEGRGFEYYSEDPVLAGVAATQEVLGMQAKGCNAYIKHFAFNEQESNRNGICVWTNEQAAREIYLRPYEMTVVDGDARCVMTSFTRLGVENCPSSKALMTSFLRDECGFVGFAVTDMYSQYSSVKMPLLMLAGCDIPDGDLMAAGGKSWDVDPFKSFTDGDHIKPGYGELAQSMREASKRILYSTVHSNAMNGMSATTKIKMIMPDWLVVVTIVDVVLGVLFLGSVAWMVVDFAMDKRKKKA